MALAHGDLVERMAGLHVKLEIQPDDAALRFELAGVYCLHGDWDLALAELERVDRLAPEKYPTDLVRGEAQLATRVPEAAKVALDRFLAAHPHQVKALTLRARALEVLAQPEASLTDYRTAWQVQARPEPDFVQEFSNALAAHGHAQEALEVLTVGIEKVGPVPGLVQLALQREIAAGRFDAALARIDTLQKSAPRVELWMAKRASVLEQAGRRAEAQSAWQALLDHLAALPNLERGSHAMSVLAEQARRQRAALAGG